jgi:hypothetical protein
LYSSFEYTSFGIQLMEGKLSTYLSDYPCIDKDSSRKADNSQSYHLFNCICDLGNAALPFEKYPFNLPVCNRNHFHVGPRSAILFT